ncbi:MAG: PrsW family intramembrane metalloprotease [Actinomycetales bacterium]|nr:PrsW family intramembrane metalloprotease [Actinomycetales bacterium]
MAATFILRCLLPPFATAVLTACIGIGLGLAASVARTVWGASGVTQRSGYASAMLLHAVWNLSATLDVLLRRSTSSAACRCSNRVPSPYCASLLKRREGDTIRRQLTAYADHGWFTYLGAMLASVPDRRRAKHWAHAWIGDRGERAMEAFAGSRASDLPLLRQRMTRAGSSAARRREPRAGERYWRPSQPIVRPFTAAAHTPTPGRWRRQVQRPRLPLLNG